MSPGPTADNRWAGVLKGGRRRWRAKPPPELFAAKGVALDSGKPSAIFFGCISEHGSTTLSSDFLSCCLCVACFHLGLYLARGVNAKRFAQFKKTSRGEKYFKLMILFPVEMIILSFVYSLKLLVLFCCVYIV